MRHDIAAILSEIRTRRFEADHTDRPLNYLNPVGLLAALADAVERQGRRVDTPDPVRAMPTLSMDDLRRLLIATAHKARNDGQSHKTDEQIANDVIIVNPWVEASTVPAPVPALVDALARCARMARQRAAISGDMAQDTPEAASRMQLETTRAVANEIADFIEVELRALRQHAAPVPDPIEVAAAAFREAEPDPARQVHAQLHVERVHREGPRADSRADRVADAVLRAMGPGIEAVRIEGRIIGRTAAGGLIIDCTDSLAFDEGQRVAVVALPATGTKEG